MNDNTTLLQQLLQDLLQVIGDFSQVANFFQDHPCGYIDDIIHHFGIHVRRDLLYKACANGHISVVRYLIGERKGSQDQYKYFASINGQNINLQPNSKKVYFRSSAQSRTTRDQLHQLYANDISDSVYYLTDDRFCDPQVKDSRQNTLLHLACRHGHVDMVRYLISEVLCDPDVQNANQLSPVHLACANGHIDIVRYLFGERGCDPEIRGQNLYTPLHFACFFGHANIVCYLVQYCGCDLEARGQQQLTPLHLACSKGHIGIVRHLVERRCNMSATSEAQNTPLHMACLNGHIDVVHYLVNQGCDLNIRNHFQATPLHTACSAGHARIVSYLVEQGCDLNAESESRPTPLCTACKKGHIDIICYFFEQGFHSSIQLQTSLLHTACSSGHIDIVHYLVGEIGCDPNGRNNDEQTPLHIASIGGYIDIVRYLVGELGCDPNSRDNDGTTPLHDACINGHTDIARYLIGEQGCDPNVRNSNQDTPLHFASREGSVDTVRYLVSELGCDPNVKNASQGAPLHFACCFGHSDIVHFLAGEQGCDLNIRDIILNTPLHVASRSGQIDIVRYFVGKCGCDPYVKNHFEVTPLQDACSEGHIKVVQYFIGEQGFDTELEYQHHFTLLHLACIRGNIDLVRYLADQGGNLSARTDEQATPLDLACAHGHTDIVRYLICEKGCNPHLEDVVITPLFYACLFGHLNVIRYLVHELGCDPKIRCKKINDSTPMHIICEVGHIDIVHYLYGECGYDPNFRNSLQATPLHTACCNGQVNIVCYLISKLGCDIEVKGQYGYTPLHYACLKGRSEFKKLCDFAKLTHSIDRDEKGVNLLLTAQSKGYSDIGQYVVDQVHDPIAKNDNTEVVHYLIERGCDPNARSDTGETPLHVACSSGYLGIVRYLVGQARCNVNAKSDTQTNPLHKACVNGHTAIVCYLVKQGCYLNAQDSNHSTPLHIACEKGHIEIVQCLSDQGCDPFAQNENHISPFQCAIETGHVEIIKYFVTMHGKEIVNGSTCCGKYTTIACPTLLEKFTMTYTPTQITPLHVACSKGQLCVVKYLVKDLGVDRNKKCSFGAESSVTPLSCACNNGHLDIVQYLLANTYTYGRMLECEVRCACFDGHANIVNYFISDRNVDPNTEDKYGNNLLQFVISGSRIKSNWKKALEVLQVLISTKRLINLNKKNYFGNTALHTACEREQFPLVKCLLQANCDPNVKNVAGCTPLWTTQQLDVIKEFIPYIPASVCERILSDDIEESKSLELLLLLVKQYNWDPNETIDDGNTALHLACDVNKLKIVEHLLDEDFNCNPNVRNRKGNTPLDMTSSSDIIRVFIRHNDICSIDFLNNSIITEAQILQLIKELPEYSVDGHDLLAVNSNDDTALHLACKTNRPTVVEFLLQECGINWDVNAKNCSGATPIQLSTNSDVIRELIRHGARPTELYSYCRKILRTSKLLETAVKVFVIGNTDVGKSTLISSLQREEWLLTRFISYVKSLILRDSTHIHTPIHHNVNTGSGVLIDDFNSKQYGHVQLYDFVGDLLFHDSQSDLLKETEFSPRIFLVVIDLSKEIEDIIRSIKFWLSFLKFIQSKPKIHTIFIGNKLNTSRNDIKAKVESLLKKETPKFSNVNDYDFITLDCRDSYSSGMSELRHCLDASCITARNPKTLAFNTHCFQVYLLDKFPDDVAITIHAIQSRIEEDKKNVSATEPLFFLPYNSQRNLLKLCNELHQKSQFIFLKNPRKIKNSWVVINKTALISHTFNIFESQLETFTTNTGVLSLSTIASVEQFKIYNLEMFINFLTHLEYCREISDKETLQLMTRTHHPISLTNERWFFFPALVKHGFPEGIWKHDSSFTYYCGWILQYNSEQFFTSHFLHVMILRVMFTYAESTSSIAELPFVQQKCSVWKSGVFWANQIGAESLVDMLPDSQSIVFMMRCRDANLIECIQHRSRVINKIRRCAKEFCSLIKLKESFINPAKIIEYPTDITSESLDLFDMNYVVEGMVNLESLEEPFVSSNTKSISLNGLLKFEPFAKLPASILSEIYNQDNPRYSCVLSDQFLTRLAEQIGKNSLFLEVISCILCECDILPSSHPSVTKDNLYIKLMKWRDIRHITYQCLQKSLDQFSVFIGLNILDMIPGLVHENEDFNTPPSSPTTSRRSSIQSEGEIKLITNHPSDQHHDPQIGEKPELHLLHMLNNHRDQKIIRVIETVAAEWEVLAYTLRFDEPRIKIINREFWRQPEEACIGMFTRWLNGEHDLEPPTWHSLIQCLERAVKFEGLAYELKKVIMLKPGNKPTMDQLCVLTARDESEIRIIETVADEDWGRMAVALGFDHPTRVNIALQASLEAVTACRDMFDRWLEGGENLKPATWSILMKCLEESGFTDMARKVNEFMLYIRQH